MFLNHGIAKDIKRHDHITDVALNQLLHAFWEIDRPCDGESAGNRGSLTAHQNFASDFDVL